MIAVALPRDLRGAWRDMVRKKKKREEGDGVGERAADAVGVVRQDGRRAAQDLALLGGDSLVD